MKIQILAVGLALLAVPLAAEEGRRIVITVKDCGRLVEHQPAPDVAYKPGTHAYGREVAPADLPGSRINIDPPKEVEFDVSFNPLKGSAAARFDDTALSVGRIKYDLAKGKMTLDGQALTDPELGEIARKCQKILKSGTK